MKSVRRDASSHEVFIRMTHDVQNLEFVHRYPLVHSLDKSAITPPKTHLRSMLCISPKESISITNFYEKKRVWVLRERREREKSQSF